VKICQALFSPHWNFPFTSLEFSFHLTGIFLSPHWNFPFTSLEFSFHHYPQKSALLRRFFGSVIKGVIKGVIKCVIKLSIKSSSKTQRLQFVNRIIVENFGLIDYAKKNKRIEYPKTSDRRESSQRASERPYTARKAAEGKCTLTAEKAHRERQSARIRRVRRQRVKMYPYRRESSQRASERPYTARKAKIAQEPPKVH